MKAVRGGKSPKELRVSRKEHLKNFNDKVEKIRLAAEEGRYFEINVPTTCTNDVLEWFKSIKGTTVLHTRPNKSAEGKTTICLESDVKLDYDFMTLGSQLKDIEIRAKGLEVQKAVKKQEKDRSPISLTFPKALGLAMWEETSKKDKDKLHFIGKHSDIEGKSIRLEFDVADCIGKDDLVRRIANIFEYADYARGNLRKKSEMDFVHGCIEASRALHPINQLATKFEWVTGKQLIELGKANVINSTAKGATLFQRFLNWFSKKRNYTYYYMDRVVEPNDAMYVIEVHKPIEPKQADHQAEIWLRYEFGEQFYRGFGITLVEYYFNDMAALSNAKQAEINEAFKADAVTDKEGEK
jgi:hypothetical protein